MEIDLGTAVIGGISIGIFSLPFILSIMGRKKREKEFLQLLSDIAAPNGCQITQYEVFGKFAIGIDAARNFAFFYKQTAEKPIVHAVDLGGIQSCRVLKAGKQYKEKEGNHQAIEKLELSFVPIAKNSPEVKMEFYNSSVNGTLCGELQSIEEWAQRINDRLKQRPSVVPSTNFPRQALMERSNRKTMA